MDVVNSKGMKGGDKRAVVEHDFMEYRKLVESKLAAHGVLKMVWTLDGAISCFTTVDDAVRAAKELINSLEVFNQNVKTLKNDFQVRCGINYGFVYYDESILLVDSGDRVVDIAVRIQKQAKPNTINVAKSMAGLIHEQNGFVPSGKVMDGYEVYVWEGIDALPQN
jgi:class 3 adenylate cyclase